MKKKVLTAVLVTAMILGMTGCGAGGGDKEAASSTNEKTTFTYWVPMYSSFASRIQSFNDIAMYKKLENDTGVHIDFIHPALGQEDEQFNLLMASPDSLPDMIEYNWTAYPGGPQKAIDDGIIISLNDYIDKSAPNFKKAITDRDPVLSPIYDKGSKTDSNQYFSFPSFNTSNARTFGGPMIRKDWLDELGLPVPETIDEWTTALRAFKEKKGAVAPLTGKRDFFIGKLNSFNGAFGVGQRLYLDGDTVKFGPIEPAYKDYIKTLSEWYSEGLLDRDFATNKDTLIDSNITGGDSGAMMGYLGGGMGRYLEQMQTEDPSYNLVCAQYPTLNKGEKNNFQLFEGDVTSRYLAITTACKDPEAAVKWADNFYGEDGYMLVNFGVEGESYTMEDGYPKYTDKVLHNPDGLTVNEALSLESRATAAAPGFKQAPEYLEQYYQFEQQIDGFKLWSECCDEARKTFIPYGVFPNQSESEEIAALSTDIETYAQEMLLKFVSGQEPIDNYDSFVETLKSKFKVERYLEICQEMYNRYLER